MTYETDRVPLTASDIVAANKRHKKIFNDRLNSIIREAFMHKFQKQMAEFDVEPMKEAPKPCPFCGATDLIVTEISNHHAVICYDHCQAEGPWMDTEEEAVEAWNRREEST